jgi:uncharacterized protein (TIGR00251 family)
MAGQSYFSLDANVQCQRPLRTASRSDRKRLSCDRRSDVGRWTFDGGPCIDIMINYAEKDGMLIFRVRVVPRASRSEVLGEHDGALRVRIAAPPVDGAANEELIRLLARAFQVSRSDVEIRAGQTSKLKQVGVSGISPEMLVALGLVR